MLSVWMQFTAPLTIIRKEIARNISQVLVFVASTTVRVMTSTEVFENSITESVVARCSSGIRVRCF